MLLALDLASRSGWAAGDPAAHHCLTPLESANGANPPPAFGAHQIAPVGTKTGPFLQRADKWFRHLYDAHRPTEVAAELVYSTGRKSNQATARKLFGLAGHCEWFFCNRGVPVHWYSTGKIRAHFILKGAGKRAEAKKMVIDACHARGWAVDNDDDMADALALFSYHVAITKGKNDG